MYCDRNKIIFYSILIPTFMSGSMYDDIHLRVARSHSSSANSTVSLISSFTLSNLLLLGLHLFLLPRTFIFIALLPTYCSSLLITCPYHFKLLSWTSFLTSHTFVVPLILSFLILSGFVPPHIHRSILVNFLRPPVYFPVPSSTPMSLPRTISAGLNTVVYTFPLIFTFIFLSHNTPDILFQYFHPLCTLWGTSPSSSLSSINIDPSYVNVFTLFAVSPCKWISASWCSLHLTIQSSSY